MSGELHQVLSSTDSKDPLAKHNTIPFNEQSLKFGEKLRTGRDFAQEGVEGLTGPFAFITKRVNKGINQTFENDPCAIYLFNGHTTYDVYAQCQLDAKPTLKQTVEREAKEYQELLPSLSPQDQVRVFEQLQDRSVMLRKYSFDDYASYYETISAKLQPTLISNLHQRALELQQGLKSEREMSAEVRTKHTQELRDIREQLIPIQKFCETQHDKVNALTDKTRELSGKLQKIHQEVLKKEIELSKNIQLSKERIEKIENTFTQFNLKYDADRAKQDQQYRAMWNTLGKIVEHQEKQQKHQEAMANVQGVSDAFGAVQQLGSLMGDKTLVTIGQLGQIGASIFKNVCLLTGYAGFTAVGGLAALGPIAALAIAGCSLVQLFGPKRPSEMQVLMEQVQALRKEMRQYFKQSFENQQRIYEAVSQMYQFLVADLKPVILGELCDLNNNIQILSDRVLGALIESKQEELKLLFKQVDDQVKQFEQYGSAGLNVAHLKQQREKLSEWIRVRLANGLLTGNNLYESTPQRKIPNDIFSDKAKYHSHALVVFLARVAQEIDPVHYQNINYRKLSHMPLLTACYTKYQQVIYLDQVAQQHTIKQEIDKQQKKLAKVNKALSDRSNDQNSAEYNKLANKERKLVKKVHKLQDKLLSLSPDGEMKERNTVLDPTVEDMSITTNVYRTFINQLESDPSLFITLINKHTASYEQLKRILAAEKVRCAGLAQENKGFFGAIRQLIDSNIPVSRDIAHCLQQMRYCQLLIASYCEIAYLDPQVYFEKLATTSEQLEQSQLDWTNVEIQHPTWKSINNAMHLKTFHTDNFMDNGDKKALIAVRNTSHFFLLKYDPTTYQLTPYATVGVPFEASSFTSKEKNHAQYGNSVRSMVLNTNGKSQFFVLFRDNSNLRIARYDEKQKSLGWCAQGPRWKSKKDNIGCQTLQVTKAICTDREIAYQGLNVNGSLILDGYDPVADRWVIHSGHKLPAGAHEYQLASVNAKVYVIYQTRNTLKVIEFNPANNQSPWRTLPDQALQAPMQTHQQAHPNPALRNARLIPVAQLHVEVCVTTLQDADKNALLITCHCVSGLEVWQLDVDQNQWQNRYVQQYSQEPSKPKGYNPMMLRQPMPVSGFIAPSHLVQNRNTHTCLIQDPQQRFLAIGAYSQADGKSVYSWRLLNLATGTIQQVKQNITRETHNIAISNGCGGEHLLQLSINNEKGLLIQQHQIFADPMLDQEQQVTKKPQVVPKGVDTKLVASTTTSHTKESETNEHDNGGYQP